MVSRRALACTALAAAVDVAAGFVAPGPLAAHRAAPKLRRAASVRAAPVMSEEAKAAYAAQEAELKEEFKKLVAGGMEAKEAATTAVANVRKKNEREARLKRFDPLAKK